MVILAGDHPSESVKVRHSALASENLPQQAIVDGRQFVADDNTVGYCPRENSIEFAIAVVMPRSAIAGVTVVLKFLKFLKFQNCPEITDCPEILGIW